MADNWNKTKMVTMMSLTSNMMNKIVTHYLNNTILLIDYTNNTYHTPTAYTLADVPFGQRQFIIIKQFVYTLTQNPAETTVYLLSSYPLWATQVNYSCTLI
jgi:hypothetical protein